MSNSEKLQQIMDQQKALLKSLESEVLRISKSDLTLENESLKKEVQNLQTNLNDYQAKLTETSFTNRELKNALYDQIYSEKLQILNQAQKKNDIYFRSEMAQEENKLITLKRTLLQRIQDFKKQLDQYRIDKTSQFDEKLALLSQEVEESISEAKVKMAQEAQDFSQSNSEQIEKLKSEQITDQMVENLGKKNNLEALLGGNLANKLGVFFLILGIIAVSRYTMYKLPDTFKGFIMFALSGALLFAGEYLNRKKPSMFSLGITSSGVAGLYVSLATSYFGLQILSGYMAIFLCVLITAGAFSLAKRYDSQTIAAFALIGGYLPLSSIADDPVLIYGAMIYFIMLNLLALGFSFYKKWKITMFIGFFLNLIGTWMIAASMYTFYRLWSPDSFGVHHIITLLYVLFAFGVYSFIPLISNYRTQRSFSKADIILLGLNTFLSTCMIYGLFYMFQLDNYHGAMTLFLALIYVGLAYFIRTHFANEPKVLALFYLTALSFVILVIPFQFGQKWLSLGWLAQGTFLSVYGIYKKENIFKRSGFLIFGLCVLAFLFFDVVTAFSYRDRLFSYKYFAVTLGSVLILGALVKNQLLLTRTETLYKYITLFNVWLFALAINYRTFNKMIRPQWESQSYNLDFLAGAAAIVLTFLVAYGLLRIPAIIDRGVQMLSLGIATFGLFHLLILLSSTPLAYPHQTIPSQVPFMVWLISTLILVGLLTLAMLAIYQMMMYFSLKKNLPIEWFPLGVSAYFLVILTQTLIHQYDLSFTSVVISLIYLVAAISFIYFGFAKRYSLLRRFGLGLAILAIVKLFLVDLGDLTQGYQIVSYFSFGAVLLGISYIYQYFTKKLLTKGEEADHDKEINS